MTLLHAHFHLRNQQAFQRLLDGSAEVKLPSGPSTSGGRSWSKPSPLASNFSDVNARDWLGRTVLHLACAATDPAALAYVRMLLAHPAINVNAYDIESRWTPLHRALYNGNLPAALLLLQHADIDPLLKDSEGYNAFDLYNSTVEWTKPARRAINAELYTWGTNRNAALGQGDADDRSFPDQIHIQPKDATDAANQNLSLQARFSPIHVRQIQMSRLHTGVVTTEAKNNLRLCGFGSGGRLGPGQSAQQYKLKPLVDFNHTIVSIALGQDHTLALTKDGEVISWGLNRFSQLGYVIEAPSANAGTINYAGFARKDEPIQFTPRKIFGPLKKLFVKGAAACKIASACWTDKEVYTWGTNHGQLGYDKAAQPVQILPRMVTKLPYPAIDIAMSDNAMVCLLQTTSKSTEVFCISNDTCFKISSPAQAFPAQMHLYRPPQATSGADIRKVTCCDDTFAVLSANGEVYTFTCALAQPPLDGTSNGVGRVTTKPQWAWTLRKQFHAVTDVALGADGTLIVCTDSGHIFVRSRASSGKSGSSGHKPFKFQRVPYLQRVTQVCASSTGAFGALRVDFAPDEILSEGNFIEQDLAQIIPWLIARPDTRSYSPTQKRRIPILGLSSLAKENVCLKPVPSRPSFVDGVSQEHLVMQSWSPEEVDEEEDSAIQTDITDLEKICRYLELCIHQHHNLDGETLNPLHGSDLTIKTQMKLSKATIPFSIPVHRVILAARNKPLCSVLSGSEHIRSKDSKIVIRFHKSELALNPGKDLAGDLEISGCHVIAILILLVYLYSDKLLCIWDRRVFTALQPQFSLLKLDVTLIKSDLHALATLIDSNYVVQALESPAKRVPSPSLRRDLSVLFAEWQSSPARPSFTSPLAPNVVLRLADKEVFCHSALLRARSLLFAHMFSEDVWTAKRWGSDGLLEIELTHLHWRPMQYVLRFICCGHDEEMFTILDDVSSLDEVLGLMFEIISAATELHLDRLVLLCSSVILKFLNITNAGYILSEATFFHARHLISRVQQYIAVNMETFLESRLLDDLDFSLIKDLAAFIREKQTEKAPTSRTNILIDVAMARQWEWLELQDIPSPIITRGNKSIARKSSAKLSPSALSKSPHSPHPTREPQVASMIAPAPKLSERGGDDIFAMDDAELTQAPAPLQATSNPSAPWKAASTLRVDMKTVMSEAASATSKTAGNSPRRDATLSEGPSRFGQRTPQRERKASSQISPAGAIGPPASSSRSTSSPWRLPEPSSATLQPPGVQPNVPMGISAAATLPPVNTGKPSSAALGGPSRQTQVTNSASQSALGPVISPIRQPTLSASSSPFPRRVSGGKAWVSPPVPPATAATPVSGMSLIAIQQLQLEQDNPPSKEKRSLREIQEEEEARVVEEDFMKWWAAEEERVRLETEILTMPRQEQPNKPRGKRPVKKDGQPAQRETRNRVSSQRRSKQPAQQKATGAAHTGPST